MCLLIGDKSRLGLEKIRKSLPDLFFKNLPRRENLLNFFCGVQFFRVVPTPRVVARLVGQRLAIFFESLILAQDERRRRG